MPIVDLTSGLFSLVVAAHGWTSDQVYNPDLTSSLRIALIISEYGGGSGQITVTDADGVNTVSRDIAGNIAQENTVVRGRPPFRVHVSAAGYTGEIVFALSAAQP